MKLRQAFGIVVTVCTLTIAFTYGAPATSKMTDQADAWSVHTKSSWAIEFVQNDNAIFAALFNYGPDGEPTWYTATLNDQGSLALSETLPSLMGHRCTIESC